MAEWFERFFEGLYGRVLTGTFDAARTLQQAHTVRTLLRLRKRQQALDIPCGIGRLTLPLARAGMEMTGVDLTAAFLRRAHREARRRGLHVRLVQRDMRDIDFNGEFDAAFNWSGSFGYFSDMDNLAFCRKVLQALKPGGRFLVEGMNRSWLLTHFRRRIVTDSRNGVRIDQRHNRYDPKTCRVESLWVMSRGSCVERHRIKMWIFNGMSIRALLRAAGFEEIRLFGYPPAGPLTRHSRRIIAVARRPAEAGAAKRVAGAGPATT